MPERPATVDPIRCGHPAPLDVTTLGDRSVRWHCSGCGQTYDGPPEAIRAAEARGRTGAIADLRDRDAVIQWLARNRLRFDEGVSQRELHAAYLEDRREH